MWRHVRTDSYSQRSRCLLHVPLLYTSVDTRKWKKFKLMSSVLRRPSRPPIPFIWKILISHEKHAGFFVVVGYSEHNITVQLFSQFSRLLDGVLWVYFDELVIYLLLEFLHWLRFFYPNWGFSTLTEVFLPWLRFFYPDWGFYTLTEIFLPWLRFFHSFSSAVRQMPRYNSQRRSTARTLPN
jgi:hypothetical protein